MTIEPNIFNFATSELSQDAFICYLLSFGQERFKNEYPDEYAIAHQFLAKCGIVDEDVKEIHKQYNNIDVLIVTNKHLLIIEDKTYTNEHDDQIIHYVEALKTDPLYSNKEGIKVCYFKTGDYVYEYKTTNEAILKQKDCCSLKRQHMTDILKKYKSDNLIIKSFYQRLNSVDERIAKCPDSNIWEWNTEKWFDYLCRVLQGHKFNIGWVNNAKGGFYGCWFDWHNVTGGEDYKQIEISFNDGKTSQVKLCYKFSGKDKETTISSKPLIKSLQEKAVAKNFTASNRIGKTTTYAYKYAESKNDVEEFINFTS